MISPQIDFCCLRSATHIALTQFYKRGSCLNIIFAVLLPILCQTYQNFVATATSLRHWKLFTILRNLKLHWSSGHFLLLACYVPNVVKRSIWDQCKKKYIWGPTDDRPTSHLAHIGEISNGHISTRGRPIHFMFGSTLGFSGSANRMALFPVSLNPRWRLGRHLVKFKWRYLRGGSSDLRRVWF